MFKASAMTCFETSLGSLEAEPDSFPQQMIDKSAAILSLSLKLRFSVPWYRLMATSTWKKLVEAEDFFFG